MVIPDDAMIIMTYDFFKLSGLIMVFPEFKDIIADI